MKPLEFQQLIREYYRRHRRSMSWRPPALKASADGTLDPYRITVSEVMLQQTQVSRVMVKFPPFVEQFPGFDALAQAPVSEVLAAWSGLGYNRRALNLQRLAVEVGRRGELPREPRELITLPGIGPGTAGSIAAFAYNRPVAFIETNVRRVFIHHFFADRSDITDRELLPLVEQTLDAANPREWYWALMDYGSWLAGQIENPNRRSRHYAKQGSFEGSNRQLRGAVLRLVQGGRMVSAKEVARHTNRGLQSVLAALEHLSAEGFVEESNGLYRLVN